MSKVLHSQTEDAEVDEVTRRLSPLADASARLPGSEAVYWRARARLALEASSRRQQSAARPMRLFHLALGVGGIAAGGILSIWPLYVEAPLGGAEKFAPAFLVAMTALGAHLLRDSLRNRVPWEMR